MTEPNELPDLHSTLARVVGANDLTDGTVPELADRLEKVRMIQDVVKNGVDALSLALASEMGDHDEYPLGEGAVVQRTPNIRKSWVDENSKEDMIAAVKRKLVEDFAADPYTGEIHPALKRCVERTVDAMEQMFSLGADPKVPFKRLFGLDPDEYRSKREQGHKVSIVRATR